MTEVLCAPFPEDPLHYHFGILFSGDPRLYRVSVHRMRNRGRDDKDSHLTLPRRAIERANLVVNLTTGEYVKNRWETPGMDRPPVTLLNMFWAVDPTQIIPVQWWND